MTCNPYTFSCFLKNKFSTGRVDKVCGFLIRKTPYANFKIGSLSKFICQWCYHNLVSREQWVKYFVIVEKARLCWNKPFYVTWECWISMGCVLIGYLVVTAPWVAFQHGKSIPNTTSTHWGRVTHICVGNLTIIGSDNGLSPERRQAIIWTNAGILLIGPTGTTFSEIEIHTFSFKEMHLKLSGKWRPFCLGLNVLTQFSNSCAGKSPVTVEFPSQRPVMQSFDLFFDLCLNKQWSKQSGGRWFGMKFG